MDERGLGVRDERGFTLAELLIACAIIGLIMGGLFGILTAGQQSYQVGTHMIEAQQDPRTTIQRIANEVRDAGYCPTCGTGSPAIAPFSAITGATATGFTVQNDWNATWNGATGIAASGTVSHVVVNADGSTTTTQRGERVTYAFGGGTLTRQEVGVDASPVILAANVASLTFTYLTAAGTVLTAPVSAANEATIRTIVVTVVGQPQVQPALFQDGRVQVAMTDTIRLRNRVP
jgi:prepilin-type N-terminal cleavage/methylation domain-containing protein